jgi:hypothetical protein
MWSQTLCTWANFAVGHSTANPLSIMQLLLLHRLHTFHNIIQLLGLMNVKLSKGALVKFDVVCSCTLWPN